MLNCPLYKCSTDPQEELQGHPVQLKWDLFAKIEICTPKQGYYHIHKFDHPLNMVIHLPIMVKNG